MVNWLTLNWGLNYDLSSLRSLKCTKPMSPRMKQYFVEFAQKP